MKYQAHHLIRSFTFLLTGLALLPSAQAAGWLVVETITKTPPSYQFGEAVAVSRNGKIAAATQALEPCTDGKLSCGAVNIYVRDQGLWNQQAKLFASDAVQNTQLGGYDFLDRTVALNDDGTVMAVATNPLALGKGAVYVFVRNGNTWSEQQKLTLPSTLLPAAQTCVRDLFGRSLALSGDGTALIVGASNECLALNTGAAYLFTKIAGQWSAQTRLVGSRVEPSGDGNQRRSGFGSSVDISGDGSTLLVGSQGLPSDLQQAYIFNKNAAGAWVEKAILTPADKPQEFGFGFSVALNRSGNAALVGAYGQGAAYIYAKSGGFKGGWKQQAKLGANISQRSTVFGFSVDLDDSGTQAIVGDWGVQKTFLFTRVGNHVWSPQFIDTLDGGNGSSVTISGDATTILVGGPGRLTTLQK